MNMTSAPPTSPPPHNGLVAGRRGLPKEQTARRAFSATTTRQQPQSPVTGSSHAGTPRHDHEDSAWLDHLVQRHETGQKLMNMFEKAEPALRFGMTVAIVSGWSLSFVGRHPVIGGGPMELANSALEACTLSLIWMAILARAACITLIENLPVDTTSSPMR